VWHVDNIIEPFIFVSFLLSRGPKCWTNDNDPRVVRVFVTLSSTTFASPMELCPSRAQQCARMIKGSDFSTGVLFMHLLNGLVTYSTPILLQAVELLM
jgi:hypothetical protein